MSASSLGRGGSAPITIASHPSRSASPTIRFVALRVPRMLPSASTLRRSSSPIAWATLSRCSCHSLAFGRSHGDGSPNATP